MKTLEEIIENTQKIIGAVIQSSTMEVRFLCPVQVWDNTGKLYGVRLQSDVQMGSMDCVSEVSFTLNVDMTDDEVSERVIAGVDAIFHRIQAKIVPKEKSEQ